jgi:hypothetical protein
VTSVRNSRYIWLMISNSVIFQVINDITSIFVKGYLHYTLGDLAYFFVFLSTLSWYFTESQFLQILGTISDLSPRTINITRIVMPITFTLCMIPLCISFITFFGEVNIISKEEYYARFPETLDTLKFLGMEIWTLTMLIWEISYGGYVYILVTRFIAEKKIEATGFLYLDRFKNLSLAVTILDSTCAGIAIYRFVFAAVDDLEAKVLVSIASYLSQFHLFLLAMIFYTIPRLIIPKAFRLKEVERKEKAVSLEKVTDSTPRSAPEPNRDYLATKKMLETVIIPFA